MSFVARLGGLTEELVSLITTTSQAADVDRFNIYRESALRGLRHHSFLRTNQFVVEDQLRGLDERFRVNNRERLADALQERLQSLSQCTNKFTPEVLHLLLELSDQPTQKSRLADLDSLRKPHEATAPKLSWEDIAREDGWKYDRDLWRNVSFDDSSEDDAANDAVSDASSSTDDTTASSADTKKRRTVQDILFKVEEPSRLQQIKDSQSWRRALVRAEQSGDSTSVQVSEIQLVREVLFMLGGLPTSLFRPDGTPRLDFQLGTVSSDAQRSLMTAFADCGCKLLVLRTFVQTEQQAPLARAFQDATRVRLLAFDQNQAALQARYITGTGDVVVSLIGLLEDVTLSAEPLFELVAVIVRLQEQKGRARPFQYLELLFEAASAAQSAGNDRAYRFLGTVFFECFEYYLRPLRLWMEEGKLRPEDGDFFVKASVGSVPLSSLWQDQFTLVHGADGVLHAPCFLQPSVKRIFATGKSVVVLQHLGRFEAEKKTWTALEPTMNFEDVCPPDLEMAPFPELFRDAFDAWIRSKHHTASAMLRSLLFESCGLRATLSALEQVYFMSDGFASGTFSSAIFGHLDNLDPIWKDRFTLTELAQESFAQLPEAHRLAVSVEHEGLANSTTAACSSVRTGLPAIRMKYQLPWPLQLVIRPDTMIGYHSVFTLLLQLSRAKDCLESYKLLQDVARPWSDVQRMYCNVRSRLLWFVTTLYSYMTSVVLAPNGGHLQDHLEAAVDVDDMIEVHAGFMKKVLSEACLNLKLGPIHDCILDILDLAIRLEQGRAAAVARREGQGPDTGRRAETGPVARTAVEQDTLYVETLQDIRSRFERHLRFMCSGLRAVARATLDIASGKWHMLAEMLETGTAE